MATDNFPALPDVPKPAFALLADVLAGLIDRTMFATSQDENRFSLNGVLLLLKPESVSMVATDGHRLALVERRQAIGAVNGELRMLIPNKALRQLRRILGEGAEEANVEIAKEDSHLFFSVGGRLLISLQLTGQFPLFRARHKGNSPSGFEWGYLGSGPAQLALAILCDYLGEPQLAVRFYEEFKEDIVARWKGDEWALTEQEIEEWFNNAARDERLRLTREAITLERQLDSMYESESDFDFKRAEELNNRIIELSVQADELRRARRSGR
jgi:hypothetical protein